MELFRISKERYKDDLTGTGARLYGGRWNNVGTAVLYSAQNRSLAMAEALVHLSSTLPLPDFVLIVLYVPDEIAAKPVNVAALPENWRRNPAFTQDLGDSWAAAGESLLLKVPSAVVRNEFNFLLNPIHPEMPRVRIVDYEPFSFDPRLHRNSS